MTLHVVLPSAPQRMWTELCWDGVALRKHFNYGKKGFNLFLILAVTLEILLELWSCE